jgi:hypothetical protein
MHISEGSADRFRISFLATLSLGSILPISYLSRDGKRLLGLETPICLPTKL